MNSVNCSGFAGSVKLSCKGMAMRGRQGGHTKWIQLTRQWLRGAAKGVSRP